MTTAMYEDVPIKSDLHEEFAVYNVGDSVPIADGVYLSYNGVAVIRDNILEATYPTIKTKYCHDVKPGYALDVILRSFKRSN